MTDEKLTMSFSIWGLFDVGEGGVYHDWDALMAQYVERGFNCIRLESGQGLLTDVEGNPIEELKFHAPFGKYTALCRQFDAVPKGGVINFRKRLLELFRAADKYNVKIVLSSWFIIHTCWFFEESVTKPLFDLTMEEKIVHIAKDLDRILYMLEEHGLRHCVAFVELINEMDGVPCNDPPIMSLMNASRKYGERIRTLHEEMLDMLKSHHPGLKVAYDVHDAFIREDMIPRNIDVLNFHSYYLWNVYQVFEQGTVTESLNELELPETTTQYLNMQLTCQDVLDEMQGGHICACFSFVPRYRLYGDINEDKLPGLEAAVEKELRDNYGHYLAKMKRNADKIVEIRDRVVPNAQLAMGEGVTYCASSKLNFEEKSDLYWQLVGEHMLYLREKGFMATVVRTTSGPEDPSWHLCRERYRAANALFMGE